MASSFGLKHTIDASRADAGEAGARMTEGRGADAVILAVAGSGQVGRRCMLPSGGRVLLFAQRREGESRSSAAVCVTKRLCWVLQSSVELHEESVRFVIEP